MKDFLRKNGLLVLCVAVLLSLLLSIAGQLTGTSADPLSNLAATVTAPVRSGVSAALDWAEGVYDYVFHYDELNAQLEQLRREKAQLEQQVLEYTQAAQENAQLRQLLGLQKKHSDFQFQTARVTQRSTTNWESTLTLSKGSSDGIQPGNCVITSSGSLVGVVEEVGTNFCQVSSVINTTLEMGGLSPRTDCAGILEGDFALMAQGRVKLSYLPDDFQLQAGDKIVTSGKGDIYPPNLTVGRVESIHDDPSGMMPYAVIRPTAPLDSLIHVYIITDFEVLE